MPRVDGGGGGWQTGPSPLSALTSLHPSFDFFLPPPLKCLRETDDKGSADNLPVFFFLSQVSFTPIFLLQQLLSLDDNRSFIKEW